MIVREPCCSTFEVDHAQGHEAEAVMPFSSVQQQSGRWAYGQGARELYAKGWTPSLNQKPWQDRRMLTPQGAQPPAILRMVFCFYGVRSFVNS
jgi:hypothetical protein